jgi:hypothetical protein
VGGHHKETQRTLSPPPNIDWRAREGGKGEAMRKYIIAMVLNNEFGLFNVNFTFAVRMLLLKIANFDTTFIIHQTMKKKHFHVSLFAVYQIINLNIRTL